MFKILKNHELLSKNPMSYYKKRPIWFFESIPVATEKEFNVIKKRGVWFTHFIPFHIILKF